jgi:hypothetical protein
MSKSSIQCTGKVWKKWNFPVMTMKINEMRKGQRKMFKKKKKNKRKEKELGSRGGEREKSCYALSSGTKLT